MTTIASETFAAGSLDRLRSLTGNDDSRFRDGQLEAIRDLVVDRARVLCVQRTGWGKSAVYFVATALLREAGAGPTLIISPLLALMRNQIAAAERLGLRAHTVNRTNREEWSRVREGLAGGMIDLLLISPERLNNPTFREELLPLFAASVGLLVIGRGALHLRLGARLPVPTIAGCATCWMRWLREWRCSGRRRRPTIVWWLTWSTS